MPYIDQALRNQFDDEIEALAKAIKLAGMKTQRPGKVNYAITKLLLLVYGDKLKYADHNEIRGVLGCVTDEWYRRRTAPYEDQKIVQNGDV